MKYIHTLRQRLENALIMLEILMNMSLGITGINVYTAKTKKNMD
jgi:hypothetical protein